MTNSSAFWRPRDDRAFEDYRPGIVASFGPIAVSEADILQFAEQFDPQPIHTNVEFAQAGPYGGLIASGCHTISLMMRLYADHFLSHEASLGGPGVDELRFTAPVRPGDELTLHTTVIDARPSRTKADRGIVRTKAELTNQHDVGVFTCVVMNLLRCRR